MPPHLPSLPRPTVTEFAVHGSVVMLLAAVAAGQLVDPPAATGRPTANVAPAVASSQDTPARAAARARAADLAAPAIPAAVIVPAAATAPVVTTVSAADIPTVAAAAYQNAAAAQAAQTPNCGISWALVAAIGLVESNHGRYGGAQLHADGSDTPHIIGIPLNGTSSDLIPDTDHGALDGDPVFDRAVGPMQFIPATWARLGMDGNGDGKADPFNIFDAARTTARYLCMDGRNVTTAAGETAAILSYNNNQNYLALVSAAAEAYASTQPGLQLPHIAVTPSPPPPSPPSPSPSSAPPAAALVAAAPTAVRSSGPVPVVGAVPMPTTLPAGGPSPTVPAAPTQPVGCPTGPSVAPTPSVTPSPSTLPTPPSTGCPTPTAPTPVPTGSVLP